MARRKNPLFDPVSQEIEAAIGGSMVVVDQWFDELDRLRSERETALVLKDELQDSISKKKKEGWQSSELKGEGQALRSIQDRINQANKDIRIFDRRIAEYYKAALGDVSERLDTFKALPGTSVYAREYRDAMRLLALAKKRSQFSNVDLRPQITQLRGAITALEEATEYARPTGLLVGLAGSRGRLKRKGTRRREPAVTERYHELAERWRPLRKMAIAADPYKSGVQKISAMERGGTDPRKVSDKDVEFAHRIRDIDLLLQVLKRKIDRGEPGQERNIENLKSQIGLISSRLGAKRASVSPESIISRIGKLRRELLALRKKTRRSPRDMEQMRGRVDEAENLINIHTTKDWSDQDRRTAIAGIRDTQAILSSMERVSIPSKVAERLDIEPTRKHRIPRGALSASKNPKKKKRKKTRKKNAYLGDAVARAKVKKEAAKKKSNKPPPIPVRLKKGNPDSERAIRRCRKLWEHYLERPGKARLQNVFKYLETMKKHGGKKVLEERNRCMKAANVEAKHLRSKR